MRWEYITKKNLKYSYPFLKNKIKNRKKYMMKRKSKLLVTRTWNLEIPIPMVIKLHRRSTDWIRLNKFWFFLQIIKEYSKFRASYCNY